jgi:hypothetical protein
MNERISKTCRKTGTNHIALDLIKYVPLGGIQFTESFVHEEYAFKYIRLDVFDTTSAFSA